MSIEMLAAASSPAVAYSSLAVDSHYRQQDQQRIAELHRKADSHDWNGQIFRRIEEEEE